MRGKQCCKASSKEGGTKSAMKKTDAPTNQKEWRMHFEDKISNANYKQAERVKPPSTKVKRQLLVTTE